MYLIVVLIYSLDKLSFSRFKEWSWIFRRRQLYWFTVSSGPDKLTDFNLPAASAKVCGLMWDSLVLDRCRERSFTSVDLAIASKSS